MACISVSMDGNINLTVLEERELVHEKTGIRFVIPAL